MSESWQPPRQERIDVKESSAVPNLSGWTAACYQALQILSKVQVIFVGPGPGSNRRPGDGGLVAF